MVKAAAYESQCEVLLSCSSSTLLSKWHGEGEKLLRALFAVASAHSSAIIFLDELDAVLSKRNDQEHEASRRFKTEFMIQMDGLQTLHNTLLLACTNCPWDLDDAVLRRMGRRMYIGMPNMDARIRVLERLLEQCQPHSLTVKQLHRLHHEGYSCSDLHGVATLAAQYPMRDLGGLNQIANAKRADIRPLTVQDLRRALTETKPSVSPDLLQRYKAWDGSRDE